METIWQEYETELRITEKALETYMRWVYEYHGLSGCMFVSGR